MLGTRDKATGEVSGTTVTMGRALAAQAGVPARIIEYTAIAKMVEDAKTGEWDIAVVAFDPARRSALDFAQPHIVVDLTYLVAPGSTIRSARSAHCYSPDRPASARPSSPSSSRVTFSATPSGSCAST